MPWPSNDKSEITELQGGRVDIASWPGGGTEVVLWMPLADPEPALSAA
ncbi:MAG: sensor histidine kinase [Piscinibacter sp.]|nr:sensor histidine kinase [Piscinibacter sp.]